MVSDRRSDGKSLKNVGAEVSGIFLFLGFSGLVYLVSGGDDEVYVGILLVSEFKSSVPSESIVSCSRVGNTISSHKFFASLGLTFGSTDLRISYIKHFNC